MAAPPTDDFKLRPLSDDLLIDPQDPLEPSRSDSIPPQPVSARSAPPQAIKPSYGEPSLEAPHSASHPTGSPLASHERVWLSPLLAVLGAGLTFALVNALDEGNGLKQTLTRSPLSQLSTLALFWWGVAQLWARARKLRWERVCLSRLSPHFTAPSVLRVVSESLTNPELTPARLRTPLKPFEHSLSGQLSWTTLRALYVEAHQGAVRYEALTQSVDRSAQLCYERVEADYKGVTAVMWLMPLSGFLGTVIGMSASIASFDTVIASAGVDLSSLAPAVSGLATAFDTTLVALSLIVPLKLAEVTLERLDHHLLDELDQKLGTGLLDELPLHELDLKAKAHLNHQSSTPAPLSERAEGLREVREALSLITEEATKAEEALSTLSTHMREQVGSLSQALGASLEGALKAEGLNTQHLTALQEELSAQGAQRYAQLERLELALTKLLEQNERPLTLMRASARPSGERRARTAPPQDRQG